MRRFVVRQLVQFDWVIEQVEHSPVQGRATPEMFT